jgi:hypothetical protein
MALTTKERKIIRDTITSGGTIRQAADAWAKSRGLTFGDTNFAYDPERGTYDSNDAWYMAEVVGLHLQGRTVEQIQSHCEYEFDESEIREMIA